MTTNNAINQNKGRILQYVVQEYNPSVKQTLTTTHADVSGSDYSFTPKSASSSIVYTYSFAIAPETTSDSVSAHFKLLVDGTLEVESETSIRGRKGSDDFITYKYIVSSWGTTVKTMKIQGREYDSTYVVKLHETLSYDGATSSKLRRATLEIIEIE